MLKRCAAIGLTSLLALACIHVVVNVYFPESEAKGALATLEDELLKGSPAKPAPKPDQPQPPPEAQPQPPQPQPQSLWLRWLRPETALAAEPITEEAIYDQIKSMPEVVAAYERIAARMPRVDALRNAGVVGEGNDGLLSPRGTIQDRREQRTISEENADRAIVIRGLAKATLLAQGLPVTEENVGKVKDGAASTFAALRRDKARPGWFIQLKDGTWTRK